ncbi:hypothetical protein DN752_13860 [Echinicola strongylocentroti]|uniref:Uncharacterized protein n=1 Tax=Echinicola strongylocentroti TaxID=1795355 RepID=A0A2Z4IJJ1_9BACT|nr:hypothetical protein [Echinicola strongylocentroti]AWW31124.1 hypothetical protein DN752_13860 [Echinicola strongylocentroti]
MTELIIYAIIFLLLFGHAIMASMMYSQVHRDESLGTKEKNDWKLKALILPIYYWGKYKSLTK